MPKWKKDAAEFTVGVNFVAGRGAQLALPKPIYELLDKPKKVKFSLKGGKKIELSASEDRRKF